jgi:hypothetical protein
MLQINFVLMFLIPSFLLYMSYITMLQAGRSPVRLPDEVDFFNLPNSSSRTIALGSPQSLTEMSAKNFPGGKKRPASRSDNLAAIYEPNI